MNFFDELVIPQSENHVLLVKYMLIITLILFIPYISMMLGATFLSTHFNKKGKRHGNNIYTRFAKDIIEKLTITKSAGLAFGTIPAASILFAYAQLLYGAKTIAVNIMALAVLIFIIAITYVYKYRNTFKIESEMEDSGHFGDNSDSGIIGKYSLLTALYLFAGTIALASNPDRWGHVGNILQIIFSWQTIFNFLVFLSFAGMVSGSAILFYFFKWQGGVKDMSKDYESFVKNFAGGLTFISSVLFPLTVFISYLYLPVSAQSQNVFLYLLVFLSFAFFICIYIYYMVKNSDTQPAALLFGLILTVLLLNIVKDQEAFGSAIEPQIIETVKTAHEIEKEVKAKLVSASGIDAALIYNTKCIACHKFDQKVVGPPYQQSVPKYNGDVNKLAEYIYNPQKIDPAFPPMPNQGLKKKEAQAIAKWLIDQVNKPKP